MLSTVYVSQTQVSSNYEIICCNNYHNVYKNEVVLRASWQLFPHIISLMNDLLSILTAQFYSEVTDLPSQSIQFFFPDRYRWTTHEFFANEWTCKLNVTWNVTITWHALNSRRIDAQTANPHDFPVSAAIANKVRALIGTVRDSGRLDHDVNEQRDSHCWRALLQSVWHGNGVTSLAVVFEIADAGRRFIKFSSTIDQIVNSLTRGDTKVFKYLNLSHVRMDNYDRLLADKFRCYLCFKKTQEFLQHFCFDCR